MATVTLRDADPERDGAALLALYAPFITDAATSFEEHVPSLAEFQDRIRTVQTSWVWLVAEVDGVVAGYAYGGSHRARAAYDYTVETSVYLGAEHHGRGIGRALYEALFARLIDLGYCMAYAGATLPNPASVGFHESLGFEVVGTFPRSGYKFGRWHDVIWMHRKLRDAPLPGPSPVRR